MSAFKFIGYFDDESKQITNKKEEVSNGNIYSVYFSKDKKDYVLLNNDTMRVPRRQEREIILDYVMRKDLITKGRCTIASVVLLSLILIVALKYSKSDDKVDDSVAVENIYRQELLQKLKASHFITGEDIKNKLVDMLNNAEVSVEDRSYRILYYLYYISFLDNGVGDNFLDELTEEGSLNSHLTFNDLMRFYVINDFNYLKVLKTPKEDAKKITYENIDVFLELSMLLSIDVSEGNIEREAYLEYIQNIGDALKDMDADLYRVWSYHINNNSMISKLLNLKILVYNKALELDF